MDRGCDIQTAFRTGTSWFNGPWPIKGEGTVTSSARLLGSLGAVVCGIGWTTLAIAGGAFGVPRSDKVIEASVRLWNGAEITVTVRDGTLATFMDERTGTMVAFLPKLDTNAEGSFDLSFWRIKETGLDQAIEIAAPIRRGVEFGDVESFDYRSGGDAGPPVQLSLYVRGVRMGTGAFTVAAESNPRDQSASVLEERFGTASGTTCCVTCDDITVCATSVVHECGKCGTTNIVAPEFLQMQLSD